MNKSNNMSIGTYTFKLLPILETWGQWQASMSEDSDPEFSFSCQLGRRFRQAGRKNGSRPRFNYQNAFEIRNEFFAIRTPRQALEFFREFGPWQLGERWGTVARAIRFSTVLERRDFFKDALLSRKIWSVRKASTPDDIRTSFEDLYLWQSLPVELKVGQDEVATARCKDIQECLRATVLLDRRQGSPWRSCARDDCGRVFMPGNRESKIYCSSDCSHLQAVRDYNKRKTTGAEVLQTKGRK